MTVTSSIVYAQPYQWQVQPSFTVVQPSIPVVPNPFSGGINKPIVQFLDIDADGDLDLYLLDSDGRLNYYENTGNANSPEFILRSLDVFDNTADRIAPGTWFRFVDIDRDGDYDLFCNAPVSLVKYYRNIGSPQVPRFELHSPLLLDDNNNPVLSESISIPTFADLDGDGDEDFFSGNSIGSIWYYENTDVTGQSFQFHFVTAEYGGIQIIGARRVPVPGEGLPVQTKAALHGAMAIDFADIDGDGDLDLFWGDFFNPSLYHLENTGSATQPQFVLRDSTYPKPNTIQTNGFNMPQFVDIDSDGRLDMFIGVLSGLSVDNFRYYKNEGTADSAAYELQSLYFLATLDHGAASSPVFADIDGDGDLDLIIGTEDGKLVQYDREGEGAGLRFVLNQNPLYAPSGFFNASPAFGDLDNDGAIDLILGEANGRIHLYRGSNRASEDMTFPLRTVVFGQNAAPALVDIDKDGDLDLFVGTGGGRIRFYRNDGTPSLHNFVLVSDFFESIDVGDDAKPVFVENDGNWNLVVGSRDSSLYYYRNNGGVFTRDTNMFTGVLSFSRAAPALNDVDNDGDLDLFLGNYKGGLLFYKNLNDVPPQPIPSHVQLSQNYPNPFNPITNIEFRTPKGEVISLRIYDVLGREVATLVNSTFEPGSYSISWNADNLPSGVYLYRLQAGTYVETKKAVLLK